MTGTQTQHCHEIVNECPTMIQMHYVKALTEICGRKYLFQSWTKDFTD